MAERSQMPGRRARRAGEGLGEGKMLTQGLLRSAQRRRARCGSLAMLLAASAAGTAGTVAAPPNAGPLRPGCDDECGLFYVSGEVYEPQPAAVASPVGTTYSVHHRVGVDLDGDGP